MRRRICFVNPLHYRCEIGGAEVQIHLLSREFAKRGWEVHWVADESNRAPPEEGDPAGMHYCRAPELSRTLADIAADVYYQRGRKQYTEAVARHARHSGAAFVFAVSMDIDCRRLKQSPRLFREGNGVLSGLKHLPGQLRLDIATLRAMRAADIVVAQTRHQQRLLQDRFGLRSELVRNIAPADSGAGGDKGGRPMILWLANIKRWKRPELFMQLVRSLPGLDCEFVMAGRLADGGRYREALEELQRRDPRFRYLGYVPYPETHSLFARATLFVNTSMANEGFPNSFIQAWQNGVPVVSLEVDPDGLIARHGLGTLASGMDSLIRHTRAYLEDAELRARTGRCAREFAAREFDADRNVTILMDAIERVIGAKRRGTSACGKDCGSSAAASPGAHR